MLVWSLQNWLITNEICPENNQEIGRFLLIVFQRSLPHKFLQNSCEISRFFREFVPKNPAWFHFFSATCQKPWLGLLLNDVLVFHENLFEIQCGQIVGIVGSNKW